MAEPPLEPAGAEPVGVEPVGVEPVGVEPAGAVADAGRRPPPGPVPGGGAPVVAQIRFVVPPDASGGPDFAESARPALDALSRAWGFRGGRIARALDEPRAWLLTSEWDGPGAWRRALSGFDVRYTLTPLLAFAADAPGTFEVLVAVDRSSDGPEGVPTTVTYRSDLAADAATAAPGRPPEGPGSRRP